jgi:GNAT superfamily N-acetyltransferase
LKKRNSNPLKLSTDCSLVQLTAETDLSSFTCSHADLDDFLKNDAKDYDKQLLGKTYIFQKDDSKEIVGFFTVSNASLHLKELSRGKKKKVDGEIPFQKRRTSYPSVLLGRLGVSSNFQGKSIGKQILDFIKVWFRYNNKTGCRFIIVDAYNEQPVLNFYQKNDFTFLQPEEDEIQQLIEERGPDAILKTRHMLFDLARLED